MLAVAGPCYADRLVLYDFILTELQARVPSCAHRLSPIHRLLKKRRDELLAFARVLDEELGQIAGALEIAPDGLRCLYIVELSRCVTATVFSYCCDEGYAFSSRPNARRSL